MSHGGGADRQLQVMWLFVVTLFLIAGRSHCQITFITAPSDTIVARGSPAILDCTFTSSVPVSITWQRDGVVLSPSLPKYTYLVNNSLVIDPTESGDEGSYSCVVTNQITSQSSSLNVTLSFAFILSSFLSEPESQTVNEGTSIIFFCIHAGSLPPAAITWRLNGNIIATSPDVVIQTSVLSHTDPPQVSSSLGIRAVQRSDTGQITCTATNPLLSGTPATSRAATLALTIQPFPPSITTHPADVIVQEGGTASFSCSAEGEPVPSITWTFAGTPLTASSLVTVTSTGGMSVLTFATVTSSNEGAYLCTATNSQGTSSSNTAQLQIARLGMTFALEPPDTTAVIGQDATLNCAPPPSLPPATVTWSRNFAQLSDPRYQVLENGTLLISALELSDQDTYYCTATNTLLGSSRTSRGAVLTAIGEPTLTPSVVTVPVGQSASFFCSAIGNPLPQITWYRETNQITAATPRVSITGSTLTISQIVIEDRGYYTCRTVFPSGTTEAQAFLNILIPPSFQNQSVNVTAVPSLPISLPCSTFPDPTLSFSWTFNGVSLSPDTSEGSLVLMEDGTLLLSNVQSGDEGIYTCSATNNLGTVNGTVYLDVLVVPIISADLAVVTAVQGSLATLQCTATAGEPVPVQSWSRNGAVLESGSRFQISPDGRVLTISNVGVGDGGVYTCHASNSAGTASAMISLDVHVAPNVEATPSTLRLIASSTANFTCTATGNPAPQVSWLTQDSVDVSTLGDSRIQVLPLTSGLAGASLIINNLQGSDQQQYVCQAVNVVSMDTSTVTLAVLVSPMVNISVETVGIQGNSLTLDCNPIGQPAPSVTWFIGPAQIQGDSRVMVDGAGRLTFSTVFSTDADTYNCRATNDVGTASGSTQLSILVVPVIQVTTPTVTVSEGFPAVLDCLASGDPRPVVTWFFNSAQLPNQATPRVQQTSNNSLIISAVQSSDEGGYICQATNTAGTESATIQLRVHVGPVAMAVESMVTATVGTVTTLRCTATGDPIPVQTWTRNGASIVDSRFQILANGGTLMISGVREEDQGVYQCHASNTAGSNSATVALNVISIPVISTPATSVTSIQGSNAILDCLATGDPQPVVTWFFNSAQLPNQGTPRVQQTLNNSLVISPVQTADRGDYMCVALNSAGNDTNMLQLIVYVAPVVTAVESSVTVVVGNDITITCIASGDPTPVQTWTRDGVGVAGPRVQISADGSALTIRDTTEDDEGMYICHASNPARTQTDTVTINIIVPPSITLARNATVLENTQHSMACSASGDPAPSITWTFEGRVVPSSQGVLTFSPVSRENDGAYTCTATNTAGTASTQVHLDVQYLPEIVDAPMNISIPAGSQATFSCVANGNPPPQTMWLFNSVVIPGALQPTYSVAMVTAANAGMYTCVATNSIGIAHQSATLLVLFPPSAPLLLEATPTSSRTLALRWTASVEDGGTPLTAYVVEYGDSAQATTDFQLRAFSPDTLSTSLDSLAPFVSYEVRVRGENIAGLSDPSNSLQARTHPEAPPAPTSFSVASFTSSSLSLTWTEPVPLNGLLAAYQLNYAREIDFASSPATQLLFSTQFTITGLQVGVVYRVEVRVSTRSLSGGALWGPFAALRVRDGVELEVPTMSPVTSPPLTSTAPPPTTTAPPPTTTAPPPTTPPTTSSPLTTAMPATTTMPPVTQSPTSPPPTEPPSTQEPTPDITTEPPTSPLNPPTSVPIGVTALNVPGTFGGVLLHWRDSSPSSSDYIGYSIIIVPRPPPTVTTPILVPRNSTGTYTHVVNGLANFTSYTITVATYNQDGLGPQTQADTIITPQSAPSAPRDVQVTPVGSSLIIVSWFPPEPPNGVLTSYTLLVLIEATGQVFNRMTITLGQAQQQDLQTVNVVGLDLDNVAYRVTVSASTSVGSGPSSEPVLIGTFDGIVTSTPPEATPPEITTDVVEGNTTDIVRDDVYYVIRIVPPVVGAFLLVAVLLAFILCCLHRRLVRKKKKGLYQFPAGTESDYRLKDIPEVGEPVILDGFDESALMENAFSSNFSTFKPPPSDSDTDSEDEPQEVGDQVILTPTATSAMGRDAVQETDDQPEGFMFNHTPSQKPRDNYSIGSNSEGGSIRSGQSSRPPFQPGDYSYAELDAIRAKKAQERAKRLGGGQGQAKATPPKGNAYSQPPGMSHGGLMETRIGAVGVARNGGLPTVPEASAHMY